MKAMRKRTGICFKCGKPTHLLVHQGCGAKDATPKALRDRAKAAANYRKGYVPRFARAGA